MLLKSTKKLSVFVKEVNNTKRQDVVRAHGDSYGVDVRRPAFDTKEASWAKHRLHSQCRVINGAKTTSLGRVPIVPWRAEHWPLVVPTQDQIKNSLIISLRYETRTVKLLQKLTLIVLRWPNIHHNFYGWYGCWRTSPWLLRWTTVSWTLLTTSVTLKTQTWQFFGLTNCLTHSVATVCTWATSTLLSITKVWLL